MPTDEKLSRRNWLRKTVLFTAAIGAPSLIGSSASLGQGKASKSVVHYRDYPNGMQMCGMCKFFEGSGMMGGGMMGHEMMAGGMMDGGMMGGGMMGHGMMGRGMMTGECEVVEGRISPMGWCDLYAPRRGYLPRTFDRYHDSDVSDKDNGRTSSGVKRCKSEDQSASLH